MTFKTTVVASAVALVAAAGAIGAPAKGGGSLHATLSGKAEVPKGDPDGRGTAEIKITGARVCWELKTAKIAAPMAAHIHKGRAGVAGPVVVGFGNVFKAKGCANAPMATASAIRTKPSGFYVNVHNARYPAGAVRGQLQEDT